MFASTAQQPIQMEALDKIYRHVCLDIETGNADELYIEKRLKTWKPHHATKPENIEVKRQEARAAITEKSALLDGAPILCVAVCADNDQFIFNSMHEHCYPIPGCTICGSDSQLGMLVKLRDWLESHTNHETVFIGHNLLRFDLPKLRRAYAVNRLWMPTSLMPPQNGYTQPVNDTARLFSYYSTEVSTDFVSLETVADYFDVATSKGIVSGADVPRLHAAGEYEKIMTYCATDCAATFLVWQLMTGNAAGMQ